jgi:Zn-dependent M16 (insulinase) family peptidase
MLISRSTDWALGDNFSQGDVEEAVLRVFQGVDAPVAPGYRGLRPFLSGIADSDLALHRDQLRAVTVADLKVVAGRYLAEPKLQGKALIGGANKNLEELGWRVHQQ